MAIQLGNTNIGSIYLGSTKISEAYIGSTKIYSATPVVQYPYLLLQCDGYGQGHPNVSSDWDYGTCNWSQVSTSPNVWKLEITNWGYNASLGDGLLFLFGSNGTPSTGTIRDSCSLIGSGNMDVVLNGHYCQSMDRMFGGCTGLEYIEPIQCTVVENVGGMFQGCTNVEEGALAQYNWFNTYGVNITNHSGTFTDCGSGTTTGAAELAQIPVGWGGTLVPASTLMTSTVRAYSSRNYTSWIITGNAPDWEDIIGLYLFTEASVSTYAGVSMNRGRVRAMNGLGTTQGTYALYFYPAFVQCSSIPGTSNNHVTWIATTDTPNGSLTTNQGNTDMPGTLDYSTYGPITRVYGNYDSTMDVYFVFLVTNEPITDFDPEDTIVYNMPMGFLYNSNFKTDGGFRYFY